MMLKQATTAWCLEVPGETPSAICPPHLQTEGTAARPFRITLNNLAPGVWTFVVTAINKNGRAAAAVTAPVTVKGELPAMAAFEPRNGL